MADISSVKLPNGQIYEIKDSVAREGLKWLLGEESLEETDADNSNE